MSDNSANSISPQEFITREDVENVCAHIRSENIKPWDWFVPTANPCVSCTLITGGHPEIMAGYCPRVNAVLSQKLEQQAGQVTLNIGEGEKSDK